MRCDMLSYYNASRIRVILLKTALAQKTNIISGHEKSALYYVFWVKLNNSSNSKIKFLCILCKSFVFFFW